MNKNNSPRNVIGDHYGDYFDYKDAAGIGGAYTVYEDCPLQNTNYYQRNERAERLCIGCGHFAVCQKLIDGVENTRDDKAADILMDILDKLREDWFASELESGQVVVSKPKWLR